MIPVLMSAPLSLVLHCQQNCVAECFLNGVFIPQQTKDRMGMGVALLLMPVGLTILTDL